MKYSKPIEFFVLMLVVTCGMMFMVNNNQVKADTVKTQQGVLIKSASLSTENVIKIPDKNEISVQPAKSVKTNVSRGDTSTEFNGVKGYDNGTNAIAAYACTLIGRPYVWGAVGPKSFDCSGLAMYVYAHFGISIPHYTGSQFEMGQSVEKKNLQTGDLVFFNTYSSISHVGIYIGGGNFVHAPGTGSNVTTSSLGEGYYLSSYAGARRYTK